MKSVVGPEVTGMTGAAAPPRRNGELVFEAPWQSRAFGVALAVTQRLGVPWRDFQRRLIAAIEARPEAPYYDCWVAALEALVLAHGLASADELETAAARVPPLG